MKGRLWGVLLVVGFVGLGCGEAEETLPATGPTPSTVGDLTNWPDVETADTDCVVEYPDDLAARDRAFAGRVESVEVGEYDEDAGARPARVAFRIEELYRGIHGDYLVLNTWDFMLPEHDITGARVLAAGDNRGDLMGCGFTRPYSEEEAQMWRETFAALPPEDCGKEVRDCYLGGDPSPVPADCSQASHEYAIASQIDDGNYPFHVIGCDGRYLSLRVNLGDCPPEATLEERRECAREKTAYFEAQKGTWSLLTYEEGTRCSTVQSLEPEFPSEFCDP